MSKVYEYKYSIWFFLKTVWPLLIILASGLLIGCGLAEIWCGSKEWEQKRIVKLVTFIFSLFIILQILLILYMQVNDYIHIENAYREDAINVVEGNVSQLQTAAREEDFCVDDIWFSYNCKDFRLGYNKLSDRGGYICENGQFVRVEYINFPFRGNVIVGLWVEEKFANR